MENADLQQNLDVDAKPRTRVGERSGAAARATSYLLLLLARRLEHSPESMQLATTATVELTIFRWRLPDTEIINVGEDDRMKSWSLLYNVFSPADPIAKSSVWGNNIPSER